MDIYLTNLTNSDRLRFPMLPTEISIKIANQFANYTILSIGAGRLPSGSPLDSISWNGILPGQKRVGAGAPFIFDWQDPKAIYRWIEQLKTQYGKPVKARLLITESPINCDVYLSSFTGTPTGGYGDISTFVHEFGHFTAYYNLGNTGAGTLDINEIQSQANEALFMPYYKKMYSEASAAKIEKQELFKSIFWSVLMGCLFDEFQRELYLKPHTYNTPQSVNALFDRLIEEYNATAYIPRPQLRYWWAEVPHTFQSPFYYISYAVSQLPALIIYEDSISDRGAAIAEYNYIQNYGDGTYTFNTLLEKAGVKSPFEKETISSLATFLDSRLLAA